MSDETRDTAVRLLHARFDLVMLQVDELRAEVDRGVSDERLEAATAELAVLADSLRELNRELIILRIEQLEGELGEESR